MGTFIKSEFLYNRAEIASGTSPTVTIGPVDIRNYEQFALMFQNGNTAIGCLELKVEAAYDTSANAASEASNWVQINTATLPQPSALGPTASVLTSAVDNVFSWIRVLIHTTATAAAVTPTGVSAGVCRVIVAGRRAN